MVILLLASAAGCVEVAPQGGDPAVTAEDTPAPAFRVSVIDPARSGFEPSIAVAPDGALFVCSPKGVSRGTDMWVSKDQASFQYLGTPLPDRLPVLRSGTGDAGGGDCDVSVDAGGRAYLVDLWVGGASVTSTTDHGATWRGVPTALAAAPLDRPWILGGEKDEVFVTAAQFNALEERLNPRAGGIWVARSTDGGLTFPQSVLAVSNDGRLGVNGNLASDGERLFVPYTQKTGEGKLALMVAVSSDRGKTWAHQVAAEQAFYPGQCISPTTLFPVVAADRTGGVHAAWALQNPETDRSDLFLASSPDGGKTWVGPTLLTDRNGTRAFPWIAAHDGEVGIAWYETNETHLREPLDPVNCGWKDMPDTAWTLHYMSVLRPFDASPTFTETLVQSEPVHHGSLGRPYADLLQVRFTPEGRAVIAYVADVAEGTARPMFAIQDQP